MSIFTKRIFYHDTDCGGIVYYANYLKHLEEARTYFLEEKNIKLKNLAEEGYFFVVRKTELNYKAPTYYGDEIQIFTSVKKISAAAIDFYQEIKRKDTLILTAKTELVFVDKNLKPCFIPSKIKVLLENEINHSK